MNKTNHIRVFISSTFKDMQDERDILVKKVFPRLRVEAEKRGMTFSYVDLRWGVVPNATPKEIIDICLSEIENCNPFFIGLIGHNYGSMIPSFNQSDRRILDEQHRGVKTLLQNKLGNLGYTELEMQYNLLFSKEKTKNYFYIKKGKASISKSSNRGCLATFIPKSLLSLKDNATESGNQNHSLEDLKSFVLDNYLNTTSYYSEETTYNNSESFEKKVFLDFMKIIGDFTIPHYIESKYVRYHQEAFLEKQNELITRSEIFNKMEEWVCQEDITEKDCTKILLIKGKLGSGRTSIIASFLNQQHQGVKILYHFVGVSLRRETPKLILRDLIAQVCSCTKIEEPRYTGDETKYDLCKLLAQYVQIVDEKIVIIIDDLEAIECDTDSLMSIISWIPTRINKLKYIVSLGQNQVLFQKCPEWIHKEELLLNELTPTECYTFSKEYLLQRYSKNIEGQYGDNNEILASEFYGKPDKLFLHNLGLLKLFLDEVSMLDFGKDKDGLELVNKIEETSKDKQVVLNQPFARIEKDIFGKEKAKAVRILSFLVLSDYGLYENDIVAICSNQEALYTQVDWSKLYCQIKPFVISDGYIKLNEAIKTTLISRYLWKKEKQNSLRIELAAQLELLNIDNRYTQEIITQYVKSGEYSHLKRLLSSPQMLAYTYRENGALLFDSLKLLKSHQLINELTAELMAAICNFNKENQLSLYEIMSEVFSETLPVYSVALNAINEAIAIQESDSHINNAKLERFADNYLKRTRLLTTIFKLEDAHKSIEDFFILLNKEQGLASSISIHVQGLIVEAKIYTHHPSIKEKQKAFPLYKEAIEKSNRKNVIDFVSLLHDYIMLCGYYIHNKDEVTHYSSLMNTFVKENALFGTYTYYKCILYLKEIELLEYKLSEKTVEDYIVFAQDLKQKLKEYIDLYGQKTRECAYFHKLIGDSYYHISSMLYAQNKYNNYVANIDNAVYHYKCYAESVDNIFEKGTKQYADSLHEVAKVHQSLIETRPMEKEMIIQKCLSWYLKEENILKELFPDGHWDIAKVYHNVSSIYKDMGNFNAAKTFIAKAIKMKCKYISEIEKSLHDSYIREIVIYKTEIVEKDIHDPKSLSKLQEKITELLTITDCLELPEQSKVLRIQEILKYQTWLDNWQNNIIVCQLEYAKELFEILKKMATDYKTRKENGNNELTNFVLHFITQWDELKAYITSHHLENEFNNDFEYNELNSMKNQIKNLLIR